MFKQWEDKTILGMLLQAVTIWYKYLLNKRMTLNNCIILKHVHITLSRVISMLSQESTQFENFNLVSDNQRLEYECFIL